MSNSSLISYTKLSPNNSGKRTHKIDTITIHCMAGDLTIESCGALFAKESTQASSNYGIGSDGRIALYVDEANRSWASSNRENDQRAVTIEVANNGGADKGWPVSDKAYTALIDLLTDICKRNNIKKLLWKGDKALIGKINQQNMTVHRWFANKSCPGDYLYNKHGQIAAEVNERLEDEDMTQDKFNQMADAYFEKKAKEDPGKWSKTEREWAEENGLVKGDEKGKKMYKSLITREELVVVLYRFYDMVKNLFNK